MPENEQETEIDKVNESEQEHEYVEYRTVLIVSTKGATAELLYKQSEHTTKSGAYSSPLVVPTLPPRASAIRSKSRRTGLRFSCSIGDEKIDED